MSSFGGYTSGWGTSQKSSIIGNYMRRKLFPRPRRRMRATVAREPINHRIRRIIKQQKERKIRDFLMSDTLPVNGTGVVTLATGIAEGDGETERDGEQIYIKSIELRGEIVGNANNTVDTLARLIVFRANSNINGVLPNVTEILESDDVLSLRQNLNRGDFTTLFDRTFIIKVPTTTADQHSVVFHKYIRFANPKICNYDLTTAVIGACEKGHLFVMRITDRPDTSEPVWNINARVSYVDK